MNGHFSQFTLPNFRVPTVDIVGDMGQPLNHGPRAEEAADLWGIEAIPKEVEISEDTAREDATA